MQGEKNRRKVGTEIRIKDEFLNYKEEKGGRGLGRMEVYDRN